MHKPSSQYFFYIYPLHWTWGGTHRNYSIYLENCHIFLPKRISLIWGWNFLSLKNGTYRWIHVKLVRLVISHLIINNFIWLYIKVLKFENKYYYKTKNSRVITDRDILLNECQKLCMYELINSMIFWYWINFWILTINNIDSLFLDWHKHVSSRQNFIKSWSFSVTW